MACSSISSRLPRILLALRNWLSSCCADGSGLPQSESCHPLATSESTLAIVSAVNKEARIVLVAPQIVDWSGKCATARVGCKKVGDLLIAQIPRLKFLSAAGDLSALSPEKPPANAARLRNDQAYWTGVDRVAMSHNPSGCNWPQDSRHISLAADNGMWF